MRPLALVQTTGFMTRKTLSNYVLSNIAVSMAWLFPIFDSFWPTRIIHKPDVN